MVDWDEGLECLIFFVGGGDYWVVFYDSVL